MKKEIVEYSGFEDNSKNPVGRPKLADKKTKKRVNTLVLDCLFIL